MYIRFQRKRLPFLKRGLLRSAIELNDRPSGVHSGESLDDDDVTARRSNQLS